MSGRLGLTVRLFCAAYLRAEMVAHFLEAGPATNEPEAPSKTRLATDWLVNENSSNAHPLAFLARLLRRYLEEEISHHGDQQAGRVELLAAFTAAGLEYVNGGTFMAHSVSPATRTLAQLVDARDLPGVLREFDRATANIAGEPREAASAAANILEAICKEYLAQHPGVAAPRSQDLGHVFAAVRSALGLDPASVEDNDLRRILTGIGGIVDGVGAFRTHASSAHAQATSVREYFIEPRHARPLCVYDR
jgi:hypothetical protein